MIEHTTQGSVLEDLRLSPEEAENLKIRVVLLASLVHHVREQKYTQRQAAEKLGVAPRQISHLMRGRISAFTIDALVNMHAAAGIAVNVEVAR